MPSEKGHPSYQLRPETLVALDSYDHVAQSVSPYDKPKERAERVVTTLDYFVPEGYPVRSFEGVALQQLASALQEYHASARRSAAGHALYDYFQYLQSDNNYTTQQIGYIGVILGDSSILKAGARHYMRDRTAPLTERDHRALHTKRPFDKHDWLNIDAGINIEHVAKVHEQTNVESQLGRAALAIDKIAHHEIDNDVELMHNILDAESFYLTLLDAFGVHALAMTLQSAAGKARLLRSGNEKALDAAREALNSAKQVPIEELLGKVFGTVPQSSAFHADKEFYDEQIIFNTTKLEELTGGRHTGSVNARFKSEGKYGLKQVRDHKYRFRQPLDVVGMMVVVKSPDELASIFTEVYERISHDETISPATAPGKEKPLHIEGTSAYINSILSRLPSNLDFNTKVAATDDPDQVYQVAKFTCDIECSDVLVPLEVQFLLERDRENSRVGQTSHPVYDERKRSGRTQREQLDAQCDSSERSLRRIHGRKAKVDPEAALVYPNSVNNGFRLQDEIEAITGKSLSWSGQK